jgi:thiol-disulfide isomerase/thioredoxin
MAAVNSQMLPLGTRLPDFELPDPDGKPHALPAHAPAYLVMFICNHCPFVKHVRHELAAIGRDYGGGGRGAAIVAINSNDAEKYPDDAPAKMKQEAQSAGYDFPYLVDADQSVAKAFHAACTPDFYVFDADRKLRYRGQLDDSRPGNREPIDGHDIRAALDAVIDGKAVDEEQQPSIGCNIKWKPGNAPDYR